MIKDAKLVFSAVNRKTGFLVLVLLTISLASLGMRLPWSSSISSSSGKPKLRPKAIIENQIKTCKQVIKDITPLIAVLERFPAITRTTVPIRYTAPDSIVSSLPAFVVKNTRAPPLAY